MIAFDHASLECGNLSSEHRNVLVVEDDPEINALVGAYAQICGFQYRHAYDGMTALDEAKREPPSAVILDLMLPDVDGYEVCRRMRREPSTTNTPIIILSALGAEKDREMGRACGANEHLTKPFDPDQLMKTLRDCANGQK